MATKKAAPKKRKQPGVEVGKYVLEFSPKVERAKANLGENPTDAQVLAEYDKLGGRITYEGQNVKMGSFYDHKNKKPVENPAPKIIRKVEVVEEEIIEPEKVKKAKVTGK